jgi:hypothetical protein
MERSALLELLPWAHLHAHEGNLPRFGAILDDYRIR